MMMIRNGARRGDWEAGPPTLADSDSDLLVSNRASGSTCARMPQGPARPHRPRSLPRHRRRRLHTQRHSTHEEGAPRVVKSMLAECTLTLAWRPEAAASDSGSLFGLQRSSNNSSRTGNSFPSDCCCYNPVPLTAP